MISVRKNVRNFARLHDSSNCNLRDCHANQLVRVGRREGVGVGIEKL